MASIYLHIPYCKQACIYCNFHFSTSIKNKNALVEAMCQELITRQDYLGNESIETIYFGGGTPSLLSDLELKVLLNTIYSNYKTVETPLEITLEANPDDLSPEKLKSLAALGINRLSIGIQSFKPDDLRQLNRAHLADQSIKCLEDAKNEGFENITIDLIYGIPNQTDKEWIQNLETMKAFDIPHFSAYALTVEPKTALSHMIKKGDLPDMDEDQTARQFLLMQDWVEANGYLGYEISNYCKPGHFSRHNSSYWQQKKYIGIGPSAHSFNLVSRQWNIANNNSYISMIQNGDLNYETEFLSLSEQYNEYILTALRTIWGVDKNYILHHFGEDYVKHVDDTSKGYLDIGMLMKKENILFLTKKGKLMADGIASDMFSERIK